MKSKQFQSYPGSKKALISGSHFTIMWRKKILFNIKINNCSPRLVIRDLTDGRMETQYAHHLGSHQELYQLPWNDTGRLNGKRVPLQAWGQSQSSAMPISRMTLLRKYLLHPRPLPRGPASPGRYLSTMMRRSTHQVVLRSSVAGEGDQPIDQVILVFEFQPKIFYMF